MKRAINVITFAALSLWLTVGIPSSAATESADSTQNVRTERPNVVVILADDQGWGDLSLHGNPNLKTPHIDSLARDGANLKNFYVCAVCSPTRAEFLTGRYHSRMGVYSTSQGGERFHLGERTIGEVFSDAGYQTAAYGKWHSGMQAPYHPNSRGFADFYGFCSGHWGNYFSPILEHNGEIVRGDGFLTDDLTNHAIEFIKKHRQSPFFVYLPLNTPHSPMQVPDSDWAPFADKDIVPDPRKENARRENQQHTRAALALCENIDRNVGRLLKSLESLEIADNTVVVYFSDNGPNGRRFNGGLRGQKGSVYEGGLRSPCLIRWPKQIQPGTEIESVAGAIDLLPTLAAFCRAEIGETRGPLDGVSFADQLTGRSEPHDSPHRALFSTWKGRASVRTQHYRYHLDGTLYEISSDRGEQNDVAKEHPVVVARLKKKLHRWREETASNDRRDHQEPTFPVGHPDSEWTQLPVRDATATGAIRRSSRHPNSTYFSNWTNADDTIRWDVDVIAEGSFDAELWYASDEQALGTELTLSFTPSDSDEAASPSTSTVVNQSTPPGHVATDFDRVARTEGYEKAWQQLPIGHLTLPSGHGTLQLSASKIQGDQGIEIRLLTLRRKK
ncbi:arylsulfatase [Rhodopirellula sallentina]|uniref:N-acetylgalactosamine 6-sulfate sulfatase (GALNS) n=1 Tax=Rhodopirellula sallentina SM41 TaxID=1263870 RepID=M5UHY0_9BACT|nr:arylsulfatase [Rhodopirellula sallentina]EMI55628.1 N-acetylgalactosamine 6-sulfate sulfatase (GALNS) [Rhodopirellula sallentina SM41]